MNRTFDKLPIEVTRLILHRLDLRSKITARRVCWLWNEIIDETLRFNVLLSRDNLKYYAKLYNQVYSMRVRNLNVTLKEELGKFMAGGVSMVAKNPTCLIFDASNKGIFGKNISTLLTLNSSLELLEFRKNSLRFIHKPLGVDGIVMPNLTELRLKLGHTFHMKIASGLAKMKMPRLRILSLVCSSSFNCMCSRLNSRVYFDFYRFLANVTSTLDKLLLVHPKTHKYRYEPFENAPECKELERIGLSVRKASLAELEIAFASIENKDGFASLGLELAMAQKRLTKLDLKIIGQTMRPRMDEIIRQNSSTLTSVIVTYTTFKMDYSQFDCQVLSLCSKLETLKIQNFYVLHPEQLPKSLKIWSTFGSFIQNPLTIIATNLTQLRELAFLPYEWETYNNVNFLQAFEDLLKMPKLTRFEVFTPQGGTVLEALFWSHPLIHFICPSSLDLRRYFLKLPHYPSYTKDFLMPTIVAHIIK